MGRKVIVEVFGRDTPVELDDGPSDDGSAGVREPRRPVPSGDAVAAEVEEPHS